MVCSPPHCDERVNARPRNVTRRVIQALAAQWVTFIQSMSPFVLAFFAGGCVTTEPKPEGHDPLDYRADFQISQFEKLPRNIDTLRAQFGAGGEVPQNCEVLWKQKHDNIRILTAERTNANVLGYVVSISNALEDALATGDFTTADNLIANGQAWASVSGERRHKARFVSYRVRLAAARGESVSNFEKLVATGTSSDATAAIFDKVGRAVIAKASGRFEAAENLFKESIWASDNFAGDRLFLHENALYEDLIWVLVKQHRLVEAEAFAREAIEKTGLGLRARYFEQEVYETDYYNGLNAGPISMLALVLLEQGRLDDALYLARVALNMQEVGCSHPASLGLNRAMSVLVTVLAELGQYSITSAVSRGLLAVARASEGDTTKVVGVLSEVFDTLANAKGDPALLRVSPAKLNRIYTGYLNTLLAISASGNLRISRIDVASEMLRVASILKTGRVHSAFRAGRIRAAVGDPELENLVRLEQDSRIKYEQTAELLLQAHLLTQAQSMQVNKAAMRRRIVELKSINRAVRAKIATEFPHNSALINPRPISARQIQTLLRANQALISYLVLEQRTLIWALPAEGAVSFSVAALPAAELRQMIGRLREDVDPSSVQSLRDIPEFDVRLSNALYRLLLAPVSDGWSSASELIVVPDDAIGSLPFAMLALSASAPEVDEHRLFDRYRRVQWLIDRYALLQLPAESAMHGVQLAGSVPPSDRRHEFLGYGDPVFSRAQQPDALTEASVETRTRFRARPKLRGVEWADLQDLPGLPDTRDEILSIAKVLAADRERDIFVGLRARESNITGKDLTA